MKAFPRDIEVQTMAIRHVGVESELGIIDGGERYSDASQSIVASIQKNISKRGLLQSIGYDGGGREFRTNPISIRSLNQVRGYKYLTEYYEELKKNTRVLTTGGTHIHISILESDNENMEANATAIATAFYTQFQKISGRESSWAGRMRETTLSQIKTHLSQQKAGDSRRYYMKGSMLNPTGHQTLEFRGGKGSNNAKEVLAWIEFLNNVVKAANRNSVEGLTFESLLKGERISEYVRSLRGWRRLTQTDLKKKFNSSNLR